MLKACLPLLVLAAMVTVPCRGQWRRVSTEPAKGEIRGAAEAGKLLVWGRDLPVAGDFGPGGCAGDVNADGRPDLILPDQARRELVWLESPQWQRRTIDSDAGFQDCLWTRLFGVRGVLVIHRYSQVRFYRPPAKGWKAQEKWPYEEVYSIYTPSAQGGLARGDVDGDGIYCGNYWLRSPAVAGLPWRLFAIQSWWELERSAMLHVMPAGKGRILFAQREADPARISWFKRPADPERFWIEEALPALDPSLRNVQGLVLADGAIVAAENAGPGSRVAGLRDATWTVFDRTDGLLGLWMVGRELVGVGPDVVIRWHHRRAD